MLIPAEKGGKLLRWVPGSTAGSKLRRLFTWVSFTLVILMLAEAVLRPGAASTAWIAFLLAALSCLYFLVVVMAVLFLSSQKFRVAPGRLAVDTLVSACFVILAFALVFRVLGISVAENCGPWDEGAMADFTESDAVYFAIVTFTTLGYGDFRPCPDARLWAGLLAMLGNMHLALIVGAGFLLASTPGVHEAEGLAADKKHNKADDSDKAAAGEGHGRDVHEAGVGFGGHQKSSVPDG